MKKLFRFILKWGFRLLLAALVLGFAWSMLWGRWTTEPLTLPPRVELTYADAAADGLITPEEIAVHYAPEINAAVNVLISGAGKGDFITAVDFDGDFSALNNWENMASHPLNAVVYWSVQETDTHWFAGYYLYHPRDDAEIWLDRHENDMEGVMLAIPKGVDAFLPPQIMYTQGHGNVFFYTDGTPVMLEGSRHEGGIALDGDRPVIYVAPNGTLSNAGHSIESALDNSTYWAVGNNGVRYYHGGQAQQPATFNGDYEGNRCSYALRPLTELWALRHGPYGDEGVFAEYGAFRGENYGVNKANPPWGWRNKTRFGFGGSFLSDPAWTINRAIDGANLSAMYTVNPYADWRISGIRAVIPVTQDASGCTVHLLCDGWEFSDPAWFTLAEEKPGTWRVTLGDEARSALYVAAPHTATWRMEIRQPDGRSVIGGVVVFTAEKLAP